MDTTVFTEISLILVIATLVAAITQYFRQPLIIGHLLTGVLVGPSVFHLIKSAETVNLFSNLGVALLLFIIGLGLNPKVFKEVGKVAVVTGLGQMAATFGLGYLLSRLLGFASLPAFYMAVALTFSSTIIVLKLLSDKKELHRLYGKIASGFLLVQDLVALTLLLFVSGFINHGGGFGSIFTTLLTGGLLALAIFVVALYVLPRVTSYLAQSQEFLFLFSLAWGLGIAALFAGLGFSIEIGALAAGVALAGSTYMYEISSRMRPLRDFFIILFFIVLGTNLSLGSVRADILPAILIAAFVLLFKPLVMIGLMGWLGYSRKTSFKTGLTAAQVSELSLVLLLLASRAGIIPTNVVSMITLVGIITFAGSAYLIQYDEQLYRLVEHYLRVFERGRPVPEPASEARYDIILFGYKASGHGFVRAFAKLERPYLVVDYDPETIDHLKSQSVFCRYGDANDPEFLEELNLDKVRLVIINLTDFSTNALIVDRIRQRNKRAIVIAMTKTDDKIEEALELYDRGASYVMMPRYLSSIKVGNLLRRYELSHSQFGPERERHKRLLYAAGA